MGGLSTAEARQRLVQYGPNEPPGAETPSLWTRLLRQFASPLIYILVFALLFDLGHWLYDGAAGWPVEALVIFVVLLLNSALGVVQEYRSEHALEQLRQLAAPQVWALRDGRLVQVPSASIVPGDVVRLEAGDRIPADGALIEANGFMVDESVLTGESLPLEKTPGEEVLAGTLAVRGTAFIELARTGAKSHLGKLATLVGRVEAGKTPLETRLDDFGHRVARWVLGLGIVIVAAGVFAEGIGQIDRVLLFAVALAVSAVPEGMPAIVTLTLALGVQHMARRNAVVRRLQAVEALGSVTVIATDKTGTLTENRMSVDELDAVDAAEALRAMVIANDADVRTTAGDPLERALIEYARSQGLNPVELRSRFERISGRPFDSAWKFMRATVESDGGPTSYLKGAAEVIIERSQLSVEERARWMRRAESAAEQGYKVLGLASAPGEGEESLRFLGLVKLWDPPRPEVAAAVRAAQEAGVRVVMITGDHAATARVVAQTIGIDGADGPVVSGPDLEASSAEEVLALVHRTSIFARVDPVHKLRIVEALKADGQIVAVTGDGVNDAPALKRSDVGVAMGRRGSDVAREVADLVLLDDNFASIVAAIEEGRGIYANIRKFICFLFSTNAAEVLLVVAGTMGAYLLGLRDPSGALLLPLTAVQILWINFITDGPPALALGVDRNAGLLRQPPRPPKSPLLDTAAMRFILFTGVFKASVAGVLLIGLPATGTSLDETRTAVFLYTGLAQLAFAYPARRIGGHPLPNVALHLSIVLAGAVQLAVLFTPWTRRGLDIVALDPVTFLIALVSVAVTWAGAEATSYVLNRSSARALRVAPVEMGIAPRLGSRH